MIRYFFTLSKPLVLTATLIMAMLTAFEPTAEAQFYNGSQLTFGKNRIQHKNFIWNYYRFTDFDTYFYANGAPLAEHCAKYGREQLKELESVLQSNLDGKIQFVIFNTLTDLKQSNLGLLSNEKYNIGGVTHILGRKVLLYFDGDYGSFDKQIRAGIAKILLDQLIYGSSLGSQVKNNALSSYPDWYISGLISYLSEEWSTKIDNFVKDGILKGRYAKLNSLKETDAMYAGHSFWKFIGDKYGKNVIPAIVYSSKMSRKAANGFALELGVSLRELEKQWLADLKARYNADDLNRNPLPKNLIVAHPKLDPLYHRLRISPDGQKAAYVSDEAGKAIVYIYDFIKKKTTRIYSIGHRLDEKVDDTYPLLAWHPTGKVLAMVVERKGFINIDFYTVAKKQWVTKIIYNLDKILDFSYSSDGLNFVMSAILKGQSDLFIFNVASNSYEQLTNDSYNDLNPRFINNNSEIVFSSNRPVDTLPSPKAKLDNIKYNPNNDIFIYDYANRSNKLKRITNSPLVNDFQPVEWAGGHVGFLSDENGITNAYIAGYDSTLTAVDTVSHYRYFSKSWSISNYKRNITDFDASVSARKVAKVVFEDKRYRMFTETMPEPSETEPLNLAGTTYRTVVEKQIPDFLKSKVKQRTGHRRLTNVLEKEVAVPKDSITGAKIKVAQDTTLYQFSRSSVLAIPKNDSVYKRKYKAVTTFVQLDTTRSVANPQQHTYNVEYFVNELVGQIDYSTLNTSYQAFSGGNGPVYLNPNFNALLMVGGTDLLEDYRISGGVRLNQDLVNNEYLLSFANLKHRFDKEFVFHRSATEETTDYNYIIRHKVHEASFIGTWPFSNVLAVKGTFSFRNDRQIWLALDKPSLQEKDNIKSWLSLKGELVYDNTRELETNIPQGTRFKVFGEYYYQINKANSTLSSVGFDFRHYLRIHRCFIWANRLAGASSFGENKIIYYMGGVDNWIGAKFNKDIPIDYTQNYAYQTLATNMRGFDQNIRNGNNFMVFNSELRLPVFKYLLNSPTRIGIIDNFQVIGFGDVGTAWSGSSPFGNNALFTRYVYQSPIMAIVHEQKDPIVEGMGFGLRTRLFGYFIRADWAWGVEDGVIQQRKFYVSLSLDF